MSEEKGSTRYRCEGCEKSVDPQQQTKSNSWGNMWHLKSNGQWCGPVVQVEDEMALSRFAGHEYHYHEERSEREPSAVARGEMTAEELDIFRECQGRVAGGRTLEYVNSLLRMRVKSALAEAREVCEARAREELRHMGCDADCQRTHRQRAAACNWCADDIAKLEG